MSRQRLAIFAAVILALGLLGRPAMAVIELLMPLGDVIDQSDAIVVAKVEKLDAGRPAAVFVMEKQLKGKGPERMLVDLGSGKPEDRQQILDRLEPGLPLVLFITELGSKRLVLAYTSGTWFGVVGQQTGDQVRWSFTNPERYLRRTFKGETAELVSTVSAALAGTSKPPAPNTKEPPGLGPTVKQGS